MRVTIELPEDGWFQAGCDTKPMHGQFCLLILRYGNRSLEVGIYIDRPYKLSKDRVESGYFISASSAWLEDGYGCNEINTTYANWGIVDRWKPLALPDGEEERMKQNLKEILGYEEEAPWEEEADEKI